MSDRQEAHVHSLCICRPSMYNTSTVIFHLNKFRLTPWHVDQWSAHFLPAHSAALWSVKWSLAVSYLPCRHGHGHGHRCRQTGMQLQAEAEIWLQLQLQCEMLVQVFVYNLCTFWPGTSHVSWVEVELLHGLTISLQSGFFIVHGTRVLMQSASPCAWPDCRLMLILMKWNQLKASGNMRNMKEVELLLLLLLLGAQSKLY